MRFGMLYELQLPKPWHKDSEQRLVDNAIEQCVLGDELGIDYAWSVEHHFLEEYSHCSATEVFLSAIAARTQRIKIGFGIRQVISYYNHPARTAEAVGMLDLVSSRPRRSSASAKAQRASNSAASPFRPNANAR